MEATQTEPYFMSRPTYDRFIKDHRELYDKVYAAFTERFWTLGGVRFHGLSQELIDELKEVDI